MTRRRQYGSGKGEASAYKPDIRVFLDLYGVIYHDTQGWQNIRCPNPDHDDYTTSCGLNVEEGAWRCHSCTVGGDVYDLIGVVLHCDYQAARHTAEIVAGGGDQTVPGGAHTRERGEYLPGGAGTRPRFRRTSPTRLRRTHGQHPGA